jgi:hypothetical protein
MTPPRSKMTNEIKAPPGDRMEGDRSENRLYTFYAPIEIFPRFC